MALPVGTSDHPASGPLPGSVRKKPHEVKRTTLDFSGNPVKRTSVHRAFGRKYVIGEPGPISGDRL
jgi:hypothetical protein